MRLVASSPYRRFLLPLLALTGALLLLTVSGAMGAKGSLVEKTIDVPRDKRVPVDITYEKATIIDVESRNDPDPKDLKEAREKDPKDHTFLLIRFRYRNDDYTKYRVNLRTILIDDSGKIVGDGSRSGSLDPKKTEDTFTFPMRIRTLDWPNATQMKVIATFKD